MFNVGGVYSVSGVYKVLNSPTQPSTDFDLRGLLRRMAEEVEAETKQVE
jgi:hypothetical protein